MNRIIQFQEIHQKSINIFIENDKKYKDLFLKLGFFKLLIQMNNKINNCLTITKNNICLINQNEIHKILYDTLFDLYNYSAMEIIYTNKKCALIVTDSILQQFQNIYEKSINIFTKKNKDYGDAFSTFGLIGVLIKINDKIKRCLTITQNKIILVKDETLQDTIIDLHNYSAIALMFIN